MNIETINYTNWAYLLIYKKIESSTSMYHLFKEKININFFNFINLKITSFLYSNKSISTLQTFSHFIWLYSVVEESFLYESNSHEWIVGRNYLMVRGKNLVYPVLPWFCSYYSLFSSFITKKIFAYVIGLLLFLVYTI